MLLLSRMVGRDVQGPHHTTVGRLLDLTAALGERGGNPSVTRLLVGRGRKEQLLVPWTSVTFFQHGIQIDGDGTGFAVASVPAALHDGEILLVRDVLDSQIVDIAGQRLARVADVILAHCPGRRVELVGVEVG